MFRLATRMLAETFVRTGEAHLPLIGVGGSRTPAQQAELTKIKAGATLVQLYTGLVYRGIGVVNEIKADLTAALKRGHRNSLVSNGWRRCRRDHGGKLADLTAASRESGDPAGV